MQQTLRDFCAMWHCIDTNFYGTMPIIGNTVF
jgi:hypothetical protein